MVPLAHRYDAFERHRRHGKHIEARGELLAIAGVEAAPEEVAVGSVRLPSAPMIRYAAPRMVDVVALEGRARDVAKFEDLTSRAASSLAVAMNTKGLRTVTVGPYARRMDVALSTDEGVRDRYTVIASWGTEAFEVADAERDRGSEGTRRAGLALGYPPCCVERFVEVERSPEAHRDGVNEASLRAFADTGTPPWELNPLSTHSLVGFMPCRADCAPALAFARRVGEALERDSAHSAGVVRATLQRPVLFFRYALFWVLDEARAHPDGAVRYARAVAHDDGSLPGLSPWRDALLGDGIARADTVALDDRAVTLSRDDEPVATWRLRAPRVPRLLVFTGG